MTKSNPISPCFSCWVVTDGKAGMENQCLGLAEALGVTPTIKHVKLRSPWKQLSPFLRHGLAYAFRSDSDPIAPPWPDLLIATGRASIPASLLVRRMSKKDGGKGTVTVQLQNPVIDPSRFDLVVVPRHDGITGPNVMTTRGSLHRITVEKLQLGADKLLPQIAHLPTPRIAVVLGGSNAVYSLTPREMVPIAAQLKALVMKEGSLIITPSRRTGEENIRILKEALDGTASYIWDGQGENPYFGILGLADTILVTCDSINMVTEACATGKPVMIIDLPGGSDKFRRFQQAMRDDDMVRPFHGQLQKWHYSPLDDMHLVAERVRRIMAKEDNEQSLH